MNRLRFRYVNHRGEEHMYLVTPTGLAFQMPPNPPGEGDFGWYVHAQVHERDGESRPGIRSFKLTDMRDMTEVSV